jgi:hypothetical protein
MPQERVRLLGLARAMWWAGLNRTGGGCLLRANDVRFPPYSDRIADAVLCRFRARSRHWPNLFDHLICTQQKRFRDRQTQRFGGGQIDHEIKLGWLLERQVGRLSTTQDLVDILGGAPE